MSPTVEGIVQTDGRKRDVSAIIAEEGRGVAAPGEDSSGKRIRSCAIIGREDADSPAPTQMYA